MLLLHCDAMEGEALEGFEVMPQASIDAVVEHLPTARPRWRGAMRGTC
ncbi:hypothetical protein ACFSLT_13215 [Novosphingobium resinovorum]